MLGCAFLLSGLVGAVELRSRPTHHRRFSFSSLLLISSTYNSGRKKERNPLTSSLFVPEQVEEVKRRRRQRDCPKVQVLTRAKTDAHNEDMSLFFLLPFFPQTMTFYLFFVSLRLEVLLATVYTRRKKERKTTEAGLVSSSFLPHHQRRNEDPPAYLLLLKFLNRQVVPFYVFILWAPPFFSFLFFTLPQSTLTN